MTEIAKGGDANELSRDINVITAEINSYKQIAGQSIFEIGKRLKHVKENDLVHGEFINWCEMTAGIPYRQANRFMKVFEEIDATKMTLASQLGLDVLYEIASMKPNERDKPHTIPSTGETKHVDEMTRKELREVKKALKEAEAQRELALRDAQILRDTLESIEDKEPEVEIRTEYVEVTDESAEQKLRKYEELFGDVSMYEGKTTRVTNGDAITYSVFEFTEDVRKFVEKYGHLTHFAKEFNGMIGEGKAEYSNAIQSMFSLLKSIERNLNESDVVIINQ
jgi:hypothetical protein